MRKVKKFKTAALLFTLALSFGFHQNSFAYALASGASYNNYYPINYYRANYYPAARPRFIAEQIRDERFEHQRCHYNEGRNRQPRYYFIRFK